MIMKFFLCIFLFTTILGHGKNAEKKNSETIWRTLLTEHANCVTWVSATVRVEVSVGGRSLPPQEQKLEALGTIIADDGLTVLSLTKVDPTSNIISRLRSPGASVQVHYTEVLILMQDGSEIPARLLLKDMDLDLAFLLPITETEESSEKFTFSATPGWNRAKNPPTPEILNEVVSISKLGRNLYRQSTLRRGWVNAVIEKPRPYFVIENTEPGTPVFDHRGRWLGVVVYKMDSGRPTAVVTLPIEDIMEIAEQVRSRNQ
ncbi:MAG: hypothetical protein CBC20_03025 [Verrucomicrobia bacterium TMED60]|jgi:hypothetical protein|nr:MAG: hypothetical protein CBC20_03025 [Verrucomicrobia bacterium TMED60]|tara:strand:+ start:1816 stop:2595 length:780 start_codon:yes stop_codon:yes gene_type:complete